LVACATALFVVWRWDRASAALALGTGGALGSAAAALEITLAVLECIACATFFTTLLKCAAYLLERRPGTTGSAAPAPQGPAPAVAVVYLCCGDLEAVALESLCRLRYRGRFKIFVHDDAVAPSARAAVDALVLRLSVETGAEIELLRRPEKGGGKPGALSYVLPRIEREFPFFLLCDNDSTAIEADALERAVPLMRDPRVAAVQCRNVGLVGSEDGRVNRILTQAIEVFDLFARFQSRFGLMPFLGHNGLLRTSSVKAAGGFLPGFFADDIDLTVRFAARGERVVYAPQIAFGETHPRSYESFRRRAFKWAFGCGQILRCHGRSILSSPRVPLTAKLGFLDFTGFYALQLLLVLYLLAGGVLAPLLAALGGPAVHASWLGSGLVACSVFLPALSFFARAGRLREAFPFAWVCALTYGSVALASAAGVFAGLRGRQREWIPTNLGGRVRRRDGWLEAGLGFALIAAPFAADPELALLPTTLLFGTVFLSTPWLLRGYVPRERAAAQRAALPQSRFVVAAERSAIAVLCAALPILLLAGDAEGSHQESHAPGARWARIEGRSFVREGRPLLLRGIHYSPWLPGTGPGKGHAWPDDARVESDLELIVGLGANAILLHDAPMRVVTAAAKHDLLVMHACYIAWSALEDEAACAAREAEIVAFAREFSQQPNALGLLLGNEVQEWIGTGAGAAKVEALLRRLYGAVKQVAPDLPTSHANWPVTKSLDLGFLDFAAFNLYPSWPREVVVRGYGEYLREVLQPVAGTRPLLVTEFGQNTLEASEEKQAAVLESCWKEIRVSAAGGFVFGFVDEWWKNYDNPISSSDWWKREHAPDDEQHHDLDPEEHYGIFHVARREKPAAARIRALFQAETSPTVASTGGRSAWWFALPALALVLYSIYSLRRGPEPASSDS
jgi:hypothetical protein